MEIKNKLEQKPQALKRLGRATFVLEKGRKLDPKEYDVIYAEKGYKGIAKNLAIILDNNTAAGKQYIKTYADKQKDPTNIGLSGNKGSGRAVYYGNNYNILGVGKTSLCTSDKPTHNSGRAELLGTLRRTIISNWISHFTGESVRHPVVIALKETGEFKWSKKPIPYSLLVRLDKGDLDRPTHAEHNPKIKINLQKIIDRYAKLDAQYFAYKMMLGAWSAGNYSLNGKVIDLETFSFVKYRGPYYTASPKHKETLFGYEGSGFIRILKQLAKTKKEREINIARAFYKSRKKYLSLCFLRLLGVTEDTAIKFFGKHCQEVTELSTQFENLAKKISPKKAELNLKHRILNSEDPSLLDVSKLFGNLDKIFKLTPAKRQKAALQLLIREVALRDIKRKIKYTPTILEDSQENPGEKFIAKHAVVTEETLSEFLSQTKSFAQNLLKLIGKLQKERGLPQGNIWSANLKSINRSLPPLYELNAKLKRWIEEYRMGKIEPKTLGKRVQQLKKPTIKIGHA